MNLNCTCFRIRRLSRQITQLYDDALRPTGLRITQFSLLSALKKNGATTAAALAEDLGADATSMSRALTAVQSKGWVLIEPGNDKRSKYVSLSCSGLEVLRIATPYWVCAQNKISNIFGSDKKNILDSKLDELSERVLSYE